MRRHILILLSFLPCAIIGVAIGTAFAPHGAKAQNKPAAVPKGVSTPVTTEKRAPGGVPKGVSTPVTTERATDVRVKSSFHGEAPLNGARSTVALNFESAQATKNTLHVVAQLSVRHAVSGQNFTFQIRVFDPLHRHTISRRFDDKSIVTQADVHKTATLDETLVLAGFPPGTYTVAVGVYDRPADITLAKMIETENDGKGRTFLRGETFRDVVIK
jgi:hypothetical protein